MMESKTSRIIKLKAYDSDIRGVYMKVAISSIRTRGTKIVRPELIKSLQELGYSVMYVGQESNEKIHSDYLKLNVPFLSIPIGRDNTDPLQEVKSLIETKKVLKDNNIEALIVYGIRTFPMMVLAGKLAGVKKILCIVNGSGRLFTLRGIKGLLVRFISYPMLCLSLLLSSHILFQNPDDLRMMKKKGLLWKRNYGTINGSGVNLNEYEFSELEKKPIFTMISRLTGSKGVNEFIEAAYVVKQFYPQAIFNLVGPMDDDDASINMEQLKKAIDEKVINLTGEVDDVRPYIKTSRVFVLPSYYPEGIPRSILEAMAIGRPIITTDSSGCRETVSDGKNGFLVTPKAPDLLADKMIWMIENEHEVKRMGEESRKICEEKFDVHKVNKKMLNSIKLL